MHFKLLMVLLFGSIMTMTAQNSGSISGKITDKTTNEPLPYVSIVIKDNGAVVTGGITDDNGLFTIKNLPLKSYTVEVQFMGYKTFVTNANLNEQAKAMNLGTIAINEVATTLDTVEIVKETSTIEQKIDRKVITVGRDLTTAGGTASEIMNNIPSVNVDQDGKISLRGNQNVRVLVDGRPTNIDPAQLLKQIPSTSIKKIELITNPSAKYNPEGMSGIINIILHKNASDGFNGTYNGGMTFGKTPKFNNSLDMNFRTGKVNFFGNIGNNLGKYANWGFVERHDDIASRQVVNGISDNKGVLGKIGMDYYINDNNTLSVYTNQNYFSGTSLFTIDVLYPEGSASPNILQSNNMDGDNFNNTYNLAYKHKFAKEGHTLDLEANYNDSQNKQSVDYGVAIADATQTYGDHLVDNRQNTTVNLDYVNPLNEKTTLEAGAEARILTTDNEYHSTNPNIPADQQNVNYTYDMSIYSAYTTFGQKFEKFSYQLGARFESYKVKADFNRGQQGFKNDYVTVYPSVYLGYNFNDKNMMQLSYSRRVDRPSIEQTKLIREFSTYLLTSIGNPQLVPQFTNSVEVNYTKMFGQGSSVTGGVYYRFINDEINRIFYPNDATPDNDQDQIMTFGNFDKNSAFGFEVSANYKIFKWWDIQPAVDFSSISQQGRVSIQTSPDVFEFQNRKVDVNAFNARLNSNFRVNQRLSFLLFGFYRGPVNGVQNLSKEMYKIDSGARYTLLDNKMSLSVRFNDMFRTMRYGFSASNPFPQSGEFRWESRTVYVGLNYMFGAGKNRALQRKQRDDNTKQGGGGMF
ncbi:TonB-dependent receptor [Flavobacterium album]|uniref:TonB-dependent receptor n=1 Tax=Flavobacterium album TaxID=2175091 RepID=A0A2S1QTL7_9FLAO|nr:TonB-dependent receptor [Flavobacterium album]AWH83716.1 TonB-dependent receptor [Flavobacterium album]